jgi:hypothetical protein
VEQGVEIKDGLINMDAWESCHGRKWWWFVLKYFLPGGPEGNHKILRVVGS